MKKVGFLALFLLGAAIGGFAQGLKPIESQVPAIKQYSFNKVFKGIDNNVVGCSIVEGSLHVVRNANSEKTKTSYLTMFKNDGTKIPIINVFDTEAGTMVIGVLESEASRDYYTAMVRELSDERVEGVFLHSVSIMKKQNIMNEKIHLSEAKNRVCLSYLVEDTKSEKWIGHAVIASSDGKDPKEIKITFKSPDLGDAKAALFEVYLGTFEGVLMVYNSKGPGDEIFTHCSRVELNSAIVEDYPILEDGRFFGQCTITKGRTPDEVMISGFIYNEGNMASGYEQIYNVMYNFKAGLDRPMEVFTEEQVRYANIAFQQKSEPAGLPIIGSDFKLKGAISLENEHVLVYAERVSIEMDDDKKGTYAQDVFVINFSPDGEVIWGYVIPRRHDLGSDVMVNLKDIKKQSPHYWETAFLLGRQDLGLLTRVPNFDPELKLASNSNFIPVWLSINLMDGISINENGMDDSQADTQKFYLSKFAEFSE